MKMPIRGLLLLALAGCAPRPSGGGNESAEPAAGAERRSDSAVVTLERGPCFGTCPVYSLTILGNGTVRFVGRRYTAHDGEATAEIPAARVDSLLAELRQGGYFGFAEEYVSGSPACGRYATDSPSVVTSVSAGGERRTIRHDYGCSDAPRELARLERRIDEVAGSARWTGR